MKIAWKTAKSKNFPGAGVWLPKNKELYVKPGKLEMSFLDALLEGKNLREAADYYGEYSAVNAKKLFNKAKQFIIEAKKNLWNHLKLSTIFLLFV